MAERDIANNDEAYAVAQWLKANKSDQDSERYQKVRTKLTTYIDNMPPSQGTPTEFGKRVMAAGQDATEVASPAPPKPQGLDATYNPADTPVPNLPQDTGPAKAAPAPSIDQGLNKKLNIFNPEARKAFYDTVGAPMAQAASGLVGGLDLAYTTAANGLGQIGAGLLGAGAAATNGGDYDSAANTIKKYSIHARPMTPQGNEVAQGFGTTVAKADDAVKEAAWRISGGNPALAAIAYSAVNMLPAEEGFVRAGSLRNSTMNLIDKTKAFYEQRGITLGSKKMEDQMTEYALDRNQDVPRPRGQALEPVITSVRQREAKMSGQIADTQKEIANSSGKVQMRGITDAVSDVDQKVASDYAPYMWQPKPPKEVEGELVPVKQTGYAWARQEVQKLMDKEAALKKGSTRSGFVSLQALDELRTKIKNLPGADNGPIAVLHDGVDNFINNQIAQGLVSGDKNLVGNTKFLSELQAKYARQFKPGTEVYRLATDLAASPEDFSKYIFSLGDKNFTTEAAQTVKQLADIFGNKSPEMDAVRMEFLGKVLEPLRGESPDWAGFRKIYDTSLRKNRTLVTALSPYMERDLEQLYRLSNASSKVGPQRGIIWSNVRRNLIREAAGNSLARNNTKLNVYNTALTFLLSKSSSDVKAGLLKELTGVERAKPLFQPGSPKLQMLWAGALDEEARK